MRVESTPAEVERILLRRVMRSSVWEWKREFSMSAGGGIFDDAILIVLYGLDVC